jgi:hypothetical protein
MSADQQPLSRRLRSAFDRAPDLQVSPALRADVVARVRAEADALNPSSATRTRSFRGWMAIAAGVVMVVGLGAGFQSWLVGGRFSILARLAAGDHQNCAIKFALDEKPIPLTEAARYDPAFGKLANMPLSSTVSGGAITVLERHSCIYGGRRFAHIVLAYKEQVVSLLVADGSVAGREWWRGAAAHELPPAQGYQMASFRAADHVVFVVSSLPAADVNAIAQSMVAPVTRSLTGA